MEKFSFKSRGPNCLWVCTKNVKLQAQLNSTFPTKQDLLSIPLILWNFWRFLNSYSNFVKASEENSNYIITISARMHYTKSRLGTLSGQAEMNTRAHSDELAVHYSRCTTSECYFRTGSELLARAKRDPDKQTCL